MDYAGSCALLFRRRQYKKTCVRESLKALNQQAYSGCAEKASELFETAKFEELQNNKEHAMQLYEEIIMKYPDSEYAKKARERLAEIRKKGDIR